MQGSMTLAQANSGNSGMFIIISIAGNNVSTVIMARICRVTV